jgi:hypothetical protein
MNYAIWTQTTGYSPNTCPGWVEYFGKRGDTPLLSSSRRVSLSPPDTLRERERKNFGAMSRELVRAMVGDLALPIA